MSKTKPVETAHREWRVVPEVGSTTYGRDSEHWDKIAQGCCNLCKREIGYGVGVFLYYPGEHALHIRCVEEDEARVIENRNNPFFIEEAARIGRVTIETFRALKNYEKDRLIEQAIAARATVTEEVAQ